ncbi:MAG: methyltransferase domain-containing protein [Leptospirales bacterium]
MDMRSVVLNKYADVATVPQTDLCCPKNYPSEWGSHIPPELFDFNYGCASPVLKAKIKMGEHVVDIGSGVGIDCFVAARIAGPDGKVTGVDMTDEMLDKARSYQQAVAQSIGYQNFEFIKGRIEEIPLPDAVADVVISNCVFNLSTDKDAVFREVRRILKPGGRTVIADIVSDRDISGRDRSDRDLWSACYSGALSLRGFIGSFIAAGFSGITQIAESPWKVKNGYRFSSFTFMAYRATKSDSCTYLGQKAIYLGPYAQVEDDDGHVFPRFEPVSVCTDTAANLKALYPDSFLLTGLTQHAHDDRTTCCNFI